MVSNSTAHRRGIFFLLALLLVSVMVVSSMLGAAGISFAEMASALKNFFSGHEVQTLNERIFLEIRLPRVLFAAVSGGIIGIGGLLLQALFRNPLVEPGLLGTSAGAAFGASVFLVFGATSPGVAAIFGLSASACAGSLLATLLALLASRVTGSTTSHPVLLLLSGVAISALFSGGVGFMSYIARDPQARSITFWNLGTFSGGSWTNASVCALLLVVGVALALPMARALNALNLGEEQAGYLGVNVRTLKWKVLLLNTVMVAVTTSFTGVIAFTGLIVPHFARMIAGADNRALLPITALCGGSLMCLSDVVARCIFQPAEMPVGIVTAVTGVPVFIFLMRRQRFYQ